MKAVVKVTNLRTLALAFSHELTDIALALGSKALDTSVDTVELIDALGNALDALRDDTGEYYQQQYERLTEEFYKNEPVA